MQHGITTLFCFRVFILVETLWSKPTRLSISTTDSQFAEFKSDIYVILGSMSKINIFKSVTILQLHYANISSQVHLAKLPKNLLAKTSLTKNTEHVLQQLPNVISSLDAFMDSSLQSASQIKTVTQLLSNMENTQLKSILPASRLHKDQNNTEPGELRVD